LFERGSFTPGDSEAVVRALNIYALGMVFAAIDFPLNYAFYARNNTQLPALVGVLSTVAYLVVALTLLNSLGYLGLVWADTAKQASHALIMLLLLFAKIGRPGAATVRTVGTILFAAVIMALVMAVIGEWLVPFLSVGRASDLVELLVVGGAGMLIYGLVLQWLGVGEVQVVWLRLRRLLPGH
jgi:putative peptidoglycan lipid II flippase